MEGLSLVRRCSLVLLFVLKNATTRLERGVIFVLVHSSTYSFTLIVCRLRLGRDRGRSRWDLRLAAVAPSRTAASPGKLVSRVFICQKLVTSMQYYCNIFLRDIV